jgi:hypothetical protein
MRSKGGCGDRGRKWLKKRRKRLGNRKRGEICKQEGKNEKRRTFTPNYISMYFSMVRRKATGVI